MSIGNSFFSFSCCISSAGFSHNPSYRLFEVGKTATAAVKQFAETGETDELDLHPRGGRRGDNTGEEEDDEEEEDDDQEEEEGGGPLFDGFSAPPVTQGAGTTHAKIFVDGNHTLVSETDRTNLVLGLSISTRALFLTRHPGQDVLYYIQVFFFVSFNVGRLF